MAVGPRDYIDQLLVKKYADEKVDNPDITSAVAPEKILTAMGDFSDMRKNTKIDYAIMCPDCSIPLASNLVSINNRGTRVF